MLRTRLLLSISLIFLSSCDKVSSYFHEESPVISVIALDLSGSQAEMRDMYISQLRTYLESLPYGSKISLIPITENSAKDYYASVRTQFPTAGFNDALLVSEKKRRRQIEGIVSMAQEWLAAKPRPMTDVIGAIEAAGKEFDGRDVTVKADLVLFSDMLQDPWKSKPFPSGTPRFEEVNVRVVGSAGSGREEEFWKTIFSKAGANLSASWWGKSFSSEDSIEDRGNKEGAAIRTDMTKEDVERLDLANKSWSCRPYSSGFHAQPIEVDDPSCAGSGEECSYHPVGEEAYVDSTDCFRKSREFCRIVFRDGVVDYALTEEGNLSACDNIYAGSKRELTVDAGKTHSGKISFDAQAEKMGYKTGSRDSARLDTIRE